MCGKILTVLSWIVVILTMPFSLFVCFKVSPWGMEIKLELLTFSRPLWIVNKAEIEFANL
jgi:hypothetical protein